MLSKLHPNIRLRLYTTFLSRLSGAMIFPFIAIYFTHELSAVIAGVMLTIQVCIEVIASFFGGYLADTVGRKRVMVIGEWINVIAFLGMIVANSPWWTSAWVTFAMIVLIGISNGLIQPSSEAMLIDVSTKETRTFMYSINYWTRNFSMMIGLIIGGWFFKTYFFEVLLALFGISLITLCITLAWIQETYSRQGKEAVSKRLGLKTILYSYQSVMHDAPFLWFTLGGIAIFAIEFQRVNFISVRLEDEFLPRTIPLLGGTVFPLDGVKLISLLSVENTLLVLLCASLAVHWIGKRSEQRTMYTGIVLFGCGYAYLAFSNDVLGLAVAVLVLTAGEILHIPTRQTILADIVNDARRGAYLAVNGLVVQFGKIGGALGIIVGEFIGGIGMSLLIVGLVVIGVYFSRLGITKRKQQGTQIRSKHTGA